MARLPRDRQDRQGIRGKHVFVAFALLALTFLLWPQPEPEPTAPAAQQPVCSLTDPQGLLGRLVGDTQACLDELRGNLPAVGGAGKTAYVKFDGDTWGQVGQAIQNPSVKETNAKLVSYGTVAVTLTAHDAAGKPIYTSELTRGNAALLQFDYLDGSGIFALKIEDAERGTFEVVLQ